MMNTFNMHRVWHRKAAVLAVASALLWSGCASTTNSGATGVNRKQLLLVSSEEVNTLSAQHYAGELQKANQSGLLNKNEMQTARVRAIADRLIPQVVAFRPDAKAWKWEVNVMENKELNAYCAPGGKIMFYTGIIDRLQLTDDEIAAIMGHEMAHALREHGRERMSRSVATNLGLSIIGARFGATAGQMQAAQIATQLGLDLPFSRGQESESDVLGLELMARGGYNPNAAVTLWQKMAKASDGAPPKFLSTHPPSNERIQVLSAKIPVVMPLYEASKYQYAPTKLTKPKKGA